MVERKNDTSTIFKFILDNKIKYLFLKMQMKTVLKFELLHNPINNCTLIFYQSCLKGS